MPSEIDATSTDRRARKHLARRDGLLATAASIVERDGIEGLTMAALAEAADYATASLYTYFPSRSALVAALQRQALGTLGTVATEALAAWDEALSDVPAKQHKAVALARLLAFGRLFMTAPEHHPYEFRLQQRLLVTPGIEELADVADVLPVALGVLAVPRQLLVDAVETGALSAPDALQDPLGNEADGHQARTLAWVAAMNGALLVEDVSIGLALDGAQLGSMLTNSLLRGWGATAAHLDAAAKLAAGLTEGVGR